MDNKKRIPWNRYDCGGPEVHCNCPDRTKCTTFNVDGTRKCYCTPTRTKNYWILYRACLQCDDSEAKPHTLRKYSQSTTAWDAAAVRFYTIPEIADFGSKNTTQFKSKVEEALSDFCVRHSLSNPWNENMIAGAGFETHPESGTTDAMTPYDALLKRMWKLRCEKDAEYKQQQDKEKAVQNRTLFYERSILVAALENESKVEHPKPAIEAFDSDEDNASSARKRRKQSIPSTPSSGIKSDDGDYSFLLLSEERRRDQAEMTKKKTEADIQHQEANTALVTAMAKQVEANAKQAEATAALFEKLAKLLDKNLQ